VTEVKNNVFPIEKHVVHLQEQVKLALYGGSTDESN
jgi:hypothetical protein